MLSESFDRGARRGPIKLPNEARVCFTIDIALELFLQASGYVIRATPGRPNEFSLSYGEYGPRVGTWRLLELFDEYHVKTGWMTNGLVAERYPKTLKAINDCGHEIIAHGWTNDAGPKVSDDLAIERQEVARTIQAIVTATGEAPTGWVSPGYGGSAARRKALSEAGMRYSCDDEAGDDLPYIIELEKQPHVIMPMTSFGSNDMQNLFLPRTSPAMFLSNFKSQFDAIYAKSILGRPGWMELLLHAHISGRLSVIGEVRQMIEYVLGHEGIWMVRRRDFVAWIFEHPEYYRW